MAIFLFALLLLPLALPWEKVCKKAQISTYLPDPPSAIKSPGVTLLPLSREPFFDNFCQVMNISQQRLGDYHFTTEGWRKDASLGFAPKTQAVLGLASTLTRQGKSVRFQLLRAVFFLRPHSPPLANKTSRGSLGRILTPFLSRNVTVMLWKGGDSKAGRNAN